VDRLGQLYLLRGNRPWIDVATPTEASRDWAWTRLPIPSGVRATGLTVRDPDAVYVIDRPQHRVVQLDRTGQLRDTWGRSGSAPGQFWQPHALALDPTGQLYVSDLGNARIQSLTPDGALGPAWGGFRDPLPPPGR
jgi:DNA-binding beta-propeller fold protein YncE